MSINYQLIKFEKAMTRSDTAKQAKIDTRVITESHAAATATRTPHPTSNIIKELITETKFYCDNTHFDQFTKIIKNLESGVYPIHLIRQAKRRYRYSNAVINKPVEKLDKKDLDFPMLTK